MIPLKEQLDADVAVIGGGIAGLMAAIAAADKGAQVVLLDKANTKRSGAGATGNDHFLCWIPEKHGDIGWKGLRAVPWRLTPEDAQADLERLAKAKGWKEWFGEHGMDSCGGSSPGR